MSHKKKPMSCLPLVGVFILVGMCGIVVLYNLTQQDDYVKPSAPEPNWASQRRYTKRPRISDLRTPYCQTTTS